MAWRERGMAEERVREDIMDRMNEHYHTGRFESAYSLSELVLEYGGDPGGDYAVLYGMSFPPADPRRVYYVQRGIEMYELGEDEMETAVTYLYAYLWGIPVDMHRMKEIWEGVDADTPKLRNMKTYVGEQ